MIGLSAPGLPPPVYPPVIYNIDRIGVGDFSKEKKSGTKSYKGDKQGQWLKPCRQMTVKVDADGHKEGTGKNGNARDLPVEVVLIKPETAPALKADSEPLDFRIEPLPAVLTPPMEARPLERLQPLPVLPVGEEGVLVITGGTICI